MNITRRGFLQGAIGLAGAGMTGALTVPALKTLLPPPVTRCNKDDAHETLTFKAESGKWYENKGNEIATYGTPTISIVNTLFTQPTNAIISQSGHATWNTCANNV